MKRSLLTAFIFFCILYGIKAQSVVPFNQRHAANNSQKNAGDPDWVRAGNKGQKNSAESKVKWAKNPFDHQVFIENKGQFDNEAEVHGKIIYQAILGNVKAYFTAKGLTYKYEKPLKKDEKGGEDENLNPEISYTSYEWKGANPNVSIEASNGEAYYYTYPTSSNSSIQVNIFKKIIYRNIYPGIDIEYSFIAGKPGIKYSIVVHPGADPSIAKLQYNGANELKLERSGDILVQGNIGEITDHAPLSYLKSSGKKIKSNYVVNGLEESFSIKANNNLTDTLIIDPWATDPAFTVGNDDAYDVDYDNAGNVYAYGSYNPFQLTKFNAAGVQQWTYNATTISHTTYGDIAVDKVTGTTYVTEGGVNAGGAKVLKVNTLGSLVATFPGTSSMLEMWRAVYNSCTHQIVIGGGGINTPNTQACLLDTDMTTFTPVNPLGATDGKHDVCLIAMDPTGNHAFMAVAQTLQAGEQAEFDNVLMSLPVPALTPASYIVPDGFGFLEAGSVAYTDLASNATNGMNGMAASPNWLYMYDGDTLKKLNKGSGAIVAVKQVSNLGPFQWGGLDADACDNAYVGVNNTIQVYSSALALTSTIPLKNVVYDVVLNSNYTIAYTGEHGYVESINLATPPSVTITNSVTPTSCAGCNGSATPTLKLCGTTPATTPTYLWSPGGQTTQTATGLCNGHYSVSISLGCGQVFIDTLTIGSGPPTSMTLTPSQTNEKCFGGTTGSASVAVTGGIGPFTYKWKPAGGATATASNLAAGNDTVIVSDAACHIDTAVFVITQPAQLRDSITATTNVSCFGGSNGTATVGVKGGTTNYTYSWNSAPVQTTATASSLPAGSYTVTVTDANGCTATANTTITQPSQMRDSIVSTTQVTCPGSNNGTATVGVKNGTPGYTYSWNTTPVQTTATATNLSVGNYTCTITDANGCTVTSVATITSLSSMRDSIVSSVNETCPGGNTGSATGGVKGGTTPYTYSWSTSPVQTNITANNLTAGTYTFTVTDKNSCVVTATVNITQPPAIRDSVSSSSNVTCFDSVTGQATVGVKGGTPGYTYAWSSTPVQTTATATKLPAGFYSCIITDANGCVSTVNVLISQPGKFFFLKAAAFSATCSGTCNGSASVIPSGGTPTYHYLWNTTPPSTTASITNLCPGSYSVQVTDNNGCKIDTTPLIVTSPPAIVITKTGTVSAHCSMADGSGGISASGGNPPYSYQWSNTSSTTTANLNNVPPGSYCVTVTDASNCTDTACIVIGNIPGPVASITGTTPVTCNGGANGTATASVTGNTGPVTYSWNSVPTQTTQTAINLKAGNYTVTITDSVGCSSTAIATVTQPSLVVTSVNTPAAICIGQSATVSATSTGGTAPYSYIWSTAATTSSITVSPVVTTTYTVNTVDANGCAGPSDSVVVTVNPALKIIASHSVNICPGASAILTAKGSGGDGVYTFTWNPGNHNGSSDTVSPVSNTYYTVTLKDNCGSPPVTDSVQVMIDPLPVVKFTADTFSGCAPQACIHFIDESTVAGGIKSWLWTFGNGAKDTSQNPKYCYDTAGKYTVGLTVTSDSGCQASGSLINMITVFSQPVAAFTDAPQPTTTVSPTITFTNQSADIYGIKTYLWRFNESPYDATSSAKDTSYMYHDTGTFCPELRVTNKHGCVDSIVHCIVINPFFTFYIPNAFTPNGDGKNDVFAPKGTFVCKFQMYIFDRWGMLLFYSEEMNQGWDGTVNGGANEAQEDTYIYVINIVDCIEYKKHSYIGRVSIIK